MGVYGWWASVCAGLISLLTDPLGVSSPARTGPSPLAPSSLSPAQPGEVDAALQRSDSGVESALLYAKAWSKYTKELLVWVERRLSMGESTGPVPPGTRSGLVESSWAIVGVVD